MKAVNLLIDSQLPPDLRDPNRALDKKSVEGLLAEVARRYPDQYPAIAKHILDVGRNAAYLQGETIGLDDLRPVVDKPTMLAQMDAEVAASDKATPNPKERKQKRTIIWSKYGDMMDKATMDNSKNNALGRSVRSGARGNSVQLRSMLTAPALYTDYKGDVVPMFIRHSFAEGMRPAEYLASSFGTRSSVVSTKKSTALGGDISKQLTSSAANIIVTEDDCGTGNGLAFNVDDPEIHNRVLARAEGKVPAGTVVDKHVLKELRKAGVKKVIARSPMTCTAKAGICSQCLGKLPEGHFAPKGYAAGITAGQAIGEPVTQSALSAKHTGGSFKGTKKEFSGFGTVSQLMQSPETFPNKAALSEASGRVSNIEEAPQGGKYIHIGEHKHYVLPGFEPLVKMGDTVEAGDPLSEGVGDVADVVRLRGLGEGRKYYVDRLRQAMAESGYGTPTKMNLEILSRAALDHVQIDDPDGIGNHLPDDTVSYSTLSNTYTPPASAKLLKPDGAVGQVLHAPALHLTIGTRLTPSMAKQLNEAGVNQVVASDEEPKFHPEMVRLRAAAHNNPDWFARLHSSYLTTGLEDAVTRAHDTNVEHNTHFAPRLAIGKDFGKNIDKTGEF